MTMTNILGQDGVACYNAEQRFNWTVSIPPIEVINPEITGAKLRISAGSRRTVAQTKTTQTPKSSQALMVAPIGLNLIVAIAKIKGISMMLNQA